MHCLRFLILSVVIFAVLHFQNYYLSIIHRHVQTEVPSDKDIDEQKIQRVKFNCTEGGEYWGVRSLITESWFVDVKVKVHGFFDYMFKDKYSREAAAKSGWNLVEIQTIFTDHLELWDGLVAELSSIIDDVCSCALQATPKQQIALGNIMEGKLIQLQLADIKSKMQNIPKANQNFKTTPLSITKYLKSQISTQLCIKTQLCGEDESDEKTCTNIDDITNFELLREEESEPDQEPDQEPDKSKWCSIL